VADSLDDVQIVGALRAVLVRPPHTGPWLQRRESMSTTRSGRIAN
jgi:hypothetical protein